MCNISLEWRLSPGRVDKLRRAAVNPPRRGLMRVGGGLGSTPASCSWEGGVHEAPGTGRNWAPGPRRRLKRRPDVNVALNLEC